MDKNKIKSDDIGSEEVHKVNILVNGASLSFNLTQKQESIMREAAEKLLKIENSFRAEAKLSDEKDYFRYASILLASNLVNIERKIDDREQHLESKLNEILKIVNNY
ncbi:MAG: cell division protein ZapA [Bacteroidetes bacterium]|nr:cell division protein ZapA [Bacteroidota bacterium]